MTDTGRAKGFKGSRAKARRRLRNLSPDAWRSGGKSPRPHGGGGIIGVGPPPLPIGPPPICNVWDELEKVNVFESMFTAPELIEYLQSMARFIESTREGADAAAAGFGVQKDSLFASLQRKIRHRVTPHTAHADRAARAFRSGSNRWATHLVKGRDPTNITVLHVTLALEDRSESALTESAKRILEEYVREVVDSVTFGDVQLERRSNQLTRQAKELLDTFFDDHGSASEWTEKNIPLTMADFPAALRRVCR